MENNMLYIFFLAAVGFFNVYAKEFYTEKPSYVKTCRLQQSSDKECYKEAVAKLAYEMYNEGIPEITQEFGTFDPYMVPLIEYNPQNSDAVKLNANLVDVLVRGISKLSVEDHKINAKNLTTKSVVATKKLDFDGRYFMNGNIFGLPINGSGNFFIHLTNVTINVFCKLDLYEKEGYNFFNVTSVKTKVKISDCKTRFDNIFKGASKEVEQSTNEVLNIFWRNLFEVQQPIINTHLERVIYRVLNKCLSVMPAHFLFSDIANFKNTGQNSIQ